MGPSSIRKSKNRFCSAGERDEYLNEKLKQNFYFAYHCIARCAYGLESLSVYQSLDKVNLWPISCQHAFLVVSVLPFYAKVKNRFPVLKLKSHAVLSHKNLKIVE